MSSAVQTLNINIITLFYRCPSRFRIMISVANILVIKIVILFDYTYKYFHDVDIAM